MTEIENRAGVDPTHPRFDACFDAHYAALLAFALRRVDGRATAEDVLSETFATAWRRRDAIPDEPLPWLYGIAIRVISNQRRSLRRRGRLGRKLALERAEVGRDPADLLGDRDAVVAAFTRLNEAQREVLRLVAWEGLDAEGAAAVLDCSAGAVRVRLYRARRELAKQLAAAGHLAHERTITPTCEAAKQTK